MCMLYFQFGKISSWVKPKLIFSPIPPGIIRPVKNRENSESNYVEESWKGIKSINEQHISYITTVKFRK